MINERKYKFDFFWSGGEDLMSAILMVFVSFVAGLCTMTIVSFYKWAFKIWSEPR